MQSSIALAPKSFFSLYHARQRKEIGEILLGVARSDDRRFFAFTHQFPENISFSGTQSWR
jgi:hypothetical protein